MHAQGPAPLPSSKKPVVTQHQCTSGIFAANVVLTSSRRSDIRILRFAVTAARDQHAACQPRFALRRRYNVHQNLSTVKWWRESSRRCMVLSARHRDTVGGADQVPGQYSSTVQSSVDDLVN